MITEIEFINERKGVKHALHADKDTRKLNAWHLARISGNGLPPITANGGSSYGIAGRSYGGLAIEGREIEAEIYADGYDPNGCQALLSEIPRVFSADYEPLGVLRLANAAGEWFRIPAKCTAFDVAQQRRRSALCNAVFDCPYPYFESDTLHRNPIFAVSGGKEYPLKRPYTFGNIEPGAGDQTVSLFNEGDVSAPCIFKLYGASLQRVEVTNQTTGASIIVSGFMGTGGGIEISTDENDVYARFANGQDASAYVSLFSDISAFKLEPGENIVNVKMDASEVTVASTEILWRGRFTTCL